MMRSMQHEDLEYFIDLYQTLNFGRSSTRCNISASALSRRIKRLEQEVGTELYQRDNRRVIPTVAGREFERYARETLARWAEVRERVTDSAARIDGEIRIYASVTACYSILPRILGRFREHYPEVHIHLKTGDAALALQTVRDEAVDLAVAALPQRSPSGLLTQVLTVTPLVCIGPAMRCAVRDLLQQRPIPWQQVPVILSEQGLSRRRVDAWYREHGIEAPVYAQVAGNEAIIAMVSLGCGAGVVPQLVVDKSPLRHDLQIIGEGPQLEPYHVGVAVSRRRLKNRSVAAFWETSRASYSGQPD
ncbi:MAG: HTH-type transcriptional activator IlvY [Spirochaetaceae bacterium]|nr:MAG: HTH-type transcriptional activator IlvY [Spirochaetaceae bacterium]